MRTGRDLIARVQRTRLPCAGGLVSGGLLGACGVRVRSGRSCVRGAQVRRGCATGVWVAACVQEGGAWHHGWAAYVGRAPFGRRGRARSLRWRARSGPGDAVSSRGAGSGIRRRLSWCCVLWLFRGFCAGRRLGRAVAATCGSDAVWKGF